MTEPAARHRALAMTFDDLPLQKLYPNDRLPPLEVLCDINRRLLETITGEGIPVIGFVNENRLHDYSRISDRCKVLEMWLDNGLQLGNHTFSHVAPETSSLSEYCSDVVRGEQLIKAMLVARNQELVYFQYPKLHTGPDREYKESLKEFLVARRYRITPVTIKHQDWAFAIAYSDAKARCDDAMIKRIAHEYLVHLEACVEFFERLSVQLLGYELRQVFLLHVNELNADYLPSIITMLRKRNYQFISLEEALRDEAYQLPDEYVGVKGPSWLHRWALTRRMTVEPEPRQPPFLNQMLYDRARLKPATDHEAMGREDVRV